MLQKRERREGGREERGGGDAEGMERLGAGAVPSPPSLPAPPPPPSAAEAGRRGGRRCA